MKQTVCWLMLVLVLTGCDYDQAAAVDKSTPPSAGTKAASRSPTAPQLSRYGELKPEIGNTTQLHKPSVIYDYNIDLPSKTGYGKPTRQRFAKINKSVGRGMVKPGETIGVRFTQSSESALIRYRLSELDADLKPLNVLFEKSGKVPFESGEGVSWSTELPKEHDDTPYLVSVEALDESGAVLDTALAYAVVPRQEVNAKLSLDKAAYRFGESAVLSLYNAGPTFLDHGYAYTIERRERERWMDIPPPYLFAAVGLTLLPGKEYTEKIALDYKGLDPGHYRFTKRFSGVGTDIKAVLGAEFDIVN